MKNTVQKYLFYPEQQNKTQKKECFTTYINLHGEIFNVVNKIHKIKKRPLITEKPLQNAN